MMKFKHHRIHLPPKRIIITAASVVVGLAVITYAILSYLAWNGIDQASLAAATHLKTSMNSSLGLGQTSGAPSDQIDSIVTDFDKTYGSNPCGVSALYSWQTFIPGVKSVQDTCNQRTTTALAVVSALKPLSAFLKADKAAAAGVTGAATSTANSADFTADAKAWHDLGTATKTVSFQPVAAKITDVVDGIGGAYTLLAIASTNQDKDAFDAATVDLKTAYGALPDINTVAIATQKQLTTTVMNAYNKL